MAINIPINQMNAAKKVCGEPVFTSDINLPNQAYMKVLFSKHPHAIIRHIDTSEAEQLPGVLGVFTAKDVPVNEFGFSINDQPVLCGSGSTKPFADRTRFIGDKIALVVAETKEIATEALGRIKVDYEPLPFYDDPFKAMEPGTTLIHPDLDSNILLHHFIRTGDTDKAFREADVIIESEYQTPAQEHIFLETEGGVAFIDENGVVTQYVAGQWPHHDRKQICHALGLPEDKVRVIYPEAIGGAFGGREDVSVQIILALAVWRLSQRGIRRPVKISLSREESILSHGKRHPYHIHAKWGATHAGKLVAAEAKLVADGGAYAFTSSMVASNSLLSCTGPYVVPNAKIDVYIVYTNNVPKAAFRGFGGPQGTFVAESQMNKLAEKLGMDPVKFRMLNLARDGDLQTTGAPFPPGCSIAQVVEQCAIAGGWENADTGWQPKKYSTLPVSGKPHIKRGIGLACAHKNVGFSFGFHEFCGVTIELQGGEQIEKALIFHAAADVGQGIHTVISQMAAEALNLPLEKIQLIPSDTLTSLDSGSVSASRMTFIAGNAILEAAKLVLEKWQDEERPAIVAHKYVGPPTTAPDPKTGHCDPNISYAYVALIAEVEVDTETGQIHIPRIICAEDVGKPINPKIVQGQIEGGLIQGYGYSTLENFIEKDGRVVTPNMSTYLIPTILDIPDEITTLMLEYPDPHGPWGARGVGEVSIMALAPAITAALHSATGIWFDQFPLTPEKVLRGMGKLDRDG
ncbi:MAG: xanthine dehydrogenase family protein molybdopterin-binding subunit [Anaerolineaceae bacterium]|nr:xanthine dehydrogenase family protein molybdopterin-binding subunit [Anaerolineaceae bacterium]